MKTRRLLSALLAVVLVLALAPMAVIAVAVDSAATEAKALGKLDKTWDALEAVEAEMLASGADKADTIIAVYETAMNLDLADKDSFSDFDKDGFFFKVNGMLCSYDYRLRNELESDGVKAEPGITTIKGNSSDGSQSANVLLIAPYYGHDSSFTNQYKLEAQSLADATGGDYTLIQSTAATGPAIAALMPDAGIIFYDSHGSQSGTSSYLCLTTNTGITSADYSNGWAVNAGSAAYIDGRYVENHISGTLPNSLIWKAICEGMKRQGLGTSGAALLRAGAGAVYGYSQSVTFRGDYEYEATFFTSMKDGATVAEAFQNMVATHGVRDPYGDAYPIVMSDVDAFPANPDAAQTVYCPWTMYGELESVDLTSYTLTPTTANLVTGGEQVVEFNRVPDNANNYELEWSSSNTSVAVVSGNARRATIKAAGTGSATITCTVKVNSQIIGTATVNVTVTGNTALDAALNVAGGTLAFGTGSQYPFQPVVVDGRDAVQSTNKGVHSSESYVSLVKELTAGTVVTFDWKVLSEGNYDWLAFAVNGANVNRISGTSNNNWATYSYTVPADGIYTLTWTYSKDDSQNSGEDRGFLDNIAIQSGGTVPTNPPSSGDVTIKLTVGDVWGDGTGYQMLLDANANTFGTIIPATGALTTSGSASAAVYAEFEYKIPVNADGALTTSNVVLNNTVTITIPAGTYDWVITNPTPGDRMWIASEQGNVGGRYDNYVFEGGKTYEFRAYLLGQNDAVDVTITGGGTPTNPPVTNPPVTNPPVGNVIFGEYFEDDATFAANWDLVSLGDADCGWYRLTTTELFVENFAYEGTGVALSYSYHNDTGPYDADNWMTTTVAIPAGGATLSWYEYALDGSYPDYYEVYVNDTVVYSGIAVNDWTNRTFNLAAYAGQTVEITFHHQDYDAYFLMIDQVEVLGGGDPGYILGDINNNGTVEAVDSLLALRHAMSLIVLNQDEILRGDVNFDTLVTAVDALVILRMSMGLV